MDVLETFLQQYFHLDTGRQVKLLETAFVLIVLLVLRYVISWVVSRNLRNRDANERYRWHKMNKYFFLFVTIVLLFRFGFKKSIRSPLI